MKTTNNHSSILDMVEGELKNISTIKDTSVSLQEFNKLKYPLPKDYNSKNVSALRKKLNVSQAVFAHLLNVKPTTVQKWERGVNCPSGSSSRLLEIFEKKGMSILS